jgi:hypothetical protein
VVANMIAEECISLVCIQEIKLHVLDDSLVSSICGGGFKYSFIPADGTRGGIMVAWHTSS